MRHSITAGLGIAFVFLAAHFALASPFTPLEWQQKVEKHAVESLIGQRKHVTWVRDRNRNFIDDEIERRFGKEDRVDVIVDLNSFVSYGKIREIFGRYGEIRYAGKLITCVFLDGVKYEHLRAIALMPEVAMVESREVFRPATDVSARSVQARASATYSPNTAGDAGLTGLGVNIALVDTGVDDDHEQLAGSFRYGFNALVFEDANMNGVDDSCEPPPMGNGACTDPDDEPGGGTANPDDEVGHGTLVAGVVLGRGAAGKSCGTPDDGSVPGTCAGVAPGAGLVDIKACHSYDCPPADVAEALDWLGLNREKLGVRVANMSFASCSNDDGTSAMAQQVSYLAALGMVMVLAHGNSINCYPLTQPGDKLTASPGSASFAVTVAGSNDKDTVTRDDDGHYVGYLKGPRTDFNLLSPNLPAMKPDIAAPAQGIFSAKYNSTDLYQEDSGTSLAAPHVTGAAALLLEARPGMHPGSVKDLLKRTADTGRNAAAYPTVDPHWDKAFGSGLLNVWPALKDASSVDVGFPTCSGPGRPCALAGGLPPWNNHVDIDTAAPLQVGMPNVITASVQNSGPIDVTVLVNFGVYVFSTGNNQFFHIGTKQEAIPANSTVTVSQPWTPSASDHQCLQVSIDFGLDINFDNNVTQRNLMVAPSLYTMRVENPFPVPAALEIKTRSRRAGWECRVDKTNFTLHPYHDPPAEVRITFDPPRNAKAGERADCDVAVYGKAAGAESTVLIGGVTVRTFVPKPCRMVGWIRDAKGRPIQGARVILGKKDRGPAVKSDGFGLVIMDAAPYLPHSVTVITEKYGRQRAEARFYCGPGTFEILVTEKGIKIESAQRGKDWSWDSQLRESVD